MSLFAAVLMLVLVMDPLGNVPIFLAALKNVPRSRYKKVIVREMLIALGVLIFFMFFGQYILLAMKLSQDALTVAGGLILLIISIKMIFPDHSISKSDQYSAEPFIVPLAIPLVAGPTTMTMVMLMPHEYPGVGKWVLALFIAWAITFVVLYSSDFLRRVLQDRGLMAIERLMGMILVVMSVQMLLSGIGHFFNIR